MFAATEYGFNITFARSYKLSDKSTLLVYYDSFALSRGDDDTSEEIEKSIVGFQHIGQANRITLPSSSFTPLSGDDAEQAEYRYDFGENASAVQDGSMVVGRDNNVHIGYSLGAGSFYSVFNPDIEAWTTYKVGRATRYINVDPSEGDTLRSNVSVTLDQQNKVHVLYEELEAEISGYLGTVKSQLRYATNRWGEWRSYNVANSDAHRFYSSKIVVDQSNVVHITYSNVFGDVYYANNQGRTIGDWNIDQLELGMAHATEVAVDNEGVVHMVYGDTYASNHSGSWQAQVLSSNDLALAVGDDNSVHLSYTKADGIYYAQQTNAGLQVERVSNRDGTGNETRIALDDEGNIYILYTLFDYSPASYRNKEIGYLSNVSGSWQDTLIDGSDWHGALPALNLDGEGKMHLVATEYFDVYGSPSDYGYPDRNGYSVLNYSKVVPNRLNIGVLITIITMGLL
jgi:hypothetical protein